MIALSIVMPAYNEEENITRTVASCTAYLERTQLSGEIIVVNDGSKDRTGALLAALAAEHPALTVLTNERNSGYGYSLQRALRASRGDLVATVDSDGQFDIADLDVLRPLLGDGCRVATGYRRKKQDSIGRVLADRLLNAIMRVFFGMRLRDTNCALKLFHGDLIRTVNIESMGFPTPTEILVKLAARREVIREAPVTHRRREGGQSALHPFRTGVRMLAFLSYLRLKLALHRRRIIREL